jgi:nitroreductase
MTTLLDQNQRTAALRRAAVRATMAPSVHNTQPWRFLVRPNQLDIYSDPSRHLRELDPTGRQLTVSCGCALFNARVSLASSGFRAEVERFPDAGQPTLFARIATTEPADEGWFDPISALDNVIELRQTNRRQFSEDVVASDVVFALEAAAAAEGAELHVVRGDADRESVAILSQRADAIQNLNPAYRAEIRAWTTDDPRRPDGVPAMAVPHVDGSAHDEVPIRDFDTHGMGWLPSATHSSRNQCLLLLGTAGDGPDSWLAAGEALEHVLLEVARNGFAASPLTQVVEVTSARAALRHELRLSMHPHILLSVGRAAATPSSRRRRLVEVLDEQP